MNTIGVGPPNFMTWSEHPGNKNEEALRYICEPERQCLKVCGAGEMAEWGQALATQPDDLSLIPGPHKVEGKN